MINIKRTVTTVLMALVLGISVTATASAKAHRSCSAKQPAKVELACATRLMQHAKFTLRWVKQRQRAPAVIPAALIVLKLAHMRMNDEYLLREATRMVSAAHERVRLETPLPTTGDFLTAVSIVQRAWPGSKRWLSDCSSSEGGHGPFVMNKGGSDAGGWMQYMPGTFYGDWDSAVSYAREHGLPLPPASSRNWKDPLGQAYAGGYAYYHNRPVGKWGGALC